MNGTSQVPEAQGEKVTELDRFWLDTTRGMVKESVASLEEAAKQLIGAVTLVEGIYFAAISFTDLRALTVADGTGSWLRIILFISPILVWLVCLIFAVMVFTPEIYKTNLGSPDLAKEVYLEIVGYKHKNLKRAHMALLAGFVFLIVAIVYYLRSVPASG